MWVFFNERTCAARGNRISVCLFFVFIWASNLTRIAFLPLFGWIGTKSNYILLCMCCSFIWGCSLHNLQICWKFNFHLNRDENLQLFELFLINHLGVCDSKCRFSGMSHRILNCMHDITLNAIYVFETCAYREKSGKNPLNDMLWYVANCDISFRVFISAIAIVSYTKYNTWFGIGM